VFENRVLRRVFGPKRDEVTGECGMLHSEKHHNLYSCPNIIRKIKSRRMRGGGAWGTFGRGEKSEQGLGGKDHSEDRGVDGRWN
jgi:hypothetical protein